MLQSPQSEKVDEVPSSSHKKTGKSLAKKVSSKPDPAGDGTGIKEKKMRKSTKAIKQEKGQPRTGAKANKEALDAIQKKLDQCIYREEFDKAQASVQRAITSVTVFKTQMKIFE